MENLERLISNLRKLNDKELALFFLGIETGIWLTQITQENRDMVVSKLKEFNYE